MTPAAPIVVESIFLRVLVLILLRLPSRRSLLQAQAQPACLISRMMTNLVLLSRWMVIAWLWGRQVPLRRLFAARCIFLMGCLL